MEKKVDFLDCLIIFFLFMWSLRMDELVLMSLGGFSTALLML